MFKSFLPKLVGIPATALPLGLMDAFGHVAPDAQGNFSDQPASLVNYVKLVTVLVPSVAAVVSFYIKTKFPLRTKAQADCVAAGVSKHMKGMAAMDPITGRAMALLDMSPEQNALINLLDNFPGLTPLRLMLNAPDIFTGTSIVRQRMRVRSAARVTWPAYMPVYMGLRPC